MLSPQAIRGHIHIELQSWFFYRKLSNDCCRSNVALHGFGTYVFQLRYIFTYCII
jgi:hypothetical protein